MRVGHVRAAAGHPAARYLDPMRDGRTGPDWREVSTGLWLLGGIAVALVVIFFLDEVRRAVEEGPRVVAVTEAAPGLEPGSAVWVAGRPAGRVLSVRFREPGAEGAGPIVVEAVLDRTAVGVLRADASARIVESSLLAPVILSLDAGTPDQPRFDFADTLRSIVGHVDQARALALVDTLRAELQEARPLAERLRRSLRAGGGTMPALRRDSTLLPSLERGFGRLEALLFGGPGEESGTLGRIASDTSLAASLERIAFSLERLSAERDSATVDRAVAELMTATDGLHASLLALEHDLEAGRGALGRAIHDTAILQQSLLLRSRLDSVRRELLEHPLRWLRFRLF